MASRTKHLDRTRHLQNLASSCQGNRWTWVSGPSIHYQQLGTFISSTPLVYRLDGTCDDLAPSSHRPPWSLARRDTSLPPRPSSWNRQGRAGRMVPVRQRLQAPNTPRCIRELGAKSAHSHRWPSCPLHIEGVGPGVTLVAAVSRHRCRQGTCGPWRIVQLGRLGTEASRSRGELGLSTIEAGDAPRSHAFRPPWLHHRLDAKVHLCQDGEILMLHRFQGEWVALGPWHHATEVRPAVAAILVAGELESSSGLIPRSSIRRGNERPRRVGGLAPSPSRYQGAKGTRRLGTDWPPSTSDRQGRSALVPRDPAASSVHMNLVAR